MFSVFPVFGSSRGGKMEARANGEGLRGGALTTLEAMVVSMLSRRRPELVEAMGHAFSEAGADEPDTTQEDVRRDAADGEPRREPIE
jgi:hypothetical protein